MHTSLTNTQFQTHLDRSSIVGCDFQNADMSASTIGEIAIIDWRGADLALPRGVAGFLLSTQKARTALQPILVDLSSKTREHLMGYLGSEVLHVIVSKDRLRRELGATALETKAIVEILLEQAPHSLADVHEA